MSLTITVPWAVPSLLHNSTPVKPLDATKKIESPTAVIRLTNPVPFRLISFNIDVPLGVPSLTYNSRPVIA